MNTTIIKQSSVSFLVGLLFAIGLSISGMTQPHKVIGFLNPWDWDPSLIFVMLGAVCIHILSYRLIKRRASPLLDAKWHVPTRKDVTPRLILGSAIFGIGWGLAGYCPGPALTSLSSGDVRSAIFVGAMIGGMLVFKLTERHLRMRE